MPEARASVILDHPIETIWECCSTPEHLAAFTPGTVEMTALTDGPLAVGTQWKGKTRFLGRTMEWRGEFVRVDTNKATDFRTIEATFPFETSTDLEETADGVRFTYTVVTGSMGGLFGKMGDPVVARAYQKSLAASLESLPDLIDAWLAER